MSERGRHIVVVGAGAGLHVAMGLRRAVASGIASPSSARRLLPVPAVPPGGGVGDDRSARRGAAASRDPPLPARGRRGDPSITTPGRSGSARRPGASDDRVRRDRPRARIPLAACCRSPASPSAGSASRPCRRRSTSATTCSRSSTSRRPRRTPRDVEPRSRSWWSGAGTRASRPSASSRTSLATRSRPLRPRSERDAVGAGRRRRPDLPELPPELGDYAREQLEERRIEVKLATAGVGGRRRDPALGRGRVPRSGARVDRRREAGAAREGLRPAGRRAGPLPVDRFLRGHRLGDAWAPATRPPSPTRPPAARRRPRRSTGCARGGASPRTSRRRSRPAARAVPLRDDRRGVLARPLPRRRDRARHPVPRVPGWFLHRSYHLLAMPTWTRRVKIAMDWTVSLLFPAISRSSARSRGRGSRSNARPAISRRRATERGRR